MKIVKINESQKKRLFEAYQNGFSLETLSMIGNGGFADEDNSVPQMRYCTQWLGYPDSMGSSRAVYTLSDNFVLKLAYGYRYQAGKEQNRVESEVYNAVNSPLLPRIMYCDDNYTFLVSESVVPAKPVDFEKILGIPFWSNYMQTSSDIKDPDSSYGGDYEVGYDKYFGNLKDRDEMEYNFNAHNIISYIVYTYAMGYSDDEPEFREYVQKSEWFTELVNLVYKTKMTDLGQIDNFGVVNRDGKPMIVILDSGFNSEVYQKFYKK
jgi:hypothetical protein